MLAWETFQSFLESKLGKESVDQWVRTLKQLHFDAGNIYLEAKDTFQIHWFEEHVRDTNQIFGRISFFICYYFNKIFFLYYLFNFFFLLDYTTLTFCLSE